MPHACANGQLPVLRGTGRRSFAISVTDVVGTPPTDDVFQTLASTLVAGFVQRYTVPIMSKKDPVKLKRLKVSLPFGISEAEMGGGSDPGKSGVVPLHRAGDSDSSRSAWS